MQLDGIQYRCRTWLVAFAFCLLSCLLPQPASCQIAKAEEYEVKAAFLLNFAKFVHWPEKSNEIRICVLGDDPFGTVLDRMASGMMIEGRPILLERMQQPNGARRCHIVFLSPSLRDT
ncbi:MAG: YfiR family protein [Terriglobales bacterium]